MLSPITAAADRSESTTLLVAKVSSLVTATVTITQAHGIRDLGIQVTLTHLDPADDFKELTSEDRDINNLKLGSAYFKFCRLMICKICRNSVHAT